MRRADRAVTDRERILQVIESCTCCRVGFSCPEGAHEGRKAELIRTAPRVGFELDCAHALAAGQTGCSYSYRYQSVIGTGVICEVQEPEEKKRALSAIMAHYEKSRLFTFTDEQAQRAAVFRLDVAQLTCKEHL